MLEVLLASEFDLSLIVVNSMQLTGPFDLKGQGYELVLTQTT